MSFLAPKNAVTMTRGTSKTLALSVTRDDGSVPNLTGAKIAFTLKAAITDDRVVVVKTSSKPSEVWITDPGGGKAEIYLIPGDTKNLPIRQYVYDIWVQLAAGERYAVVPPTTLDLQLGATVL